MPFINENLSWWITAIEIPVCAGILWFIFKIRAEAQEMNVKLHDILDVRTSQLRESLAAFKLEVAKNYASIGDVKDLEMRIVSHLLRIESKLDQTALKTEALKAQKKE